MIKNKSLRKPPPGKSESIKQHKQNSSLHQPPPKSESIKQPEQNSLLNTMKDGFSFGIGSSMGNMIVNQIFDKKEINISNTNDKNISEKKIFTDKVEIINNTEILFKKYNECIDNKKDNDISECLKILEKK